MIQPIRREDTQPFLVTHALSATLARPSQSRFDKGRRGHQRTLHNPLICHARFLCYKCQLELKPKPTTTCYTCQLKPKQTAKHHTLHMPNQAKYHTLHSSAQIIAKAKYHMLHSQLKPTAIAFRHRSKHCTRAQSSLPRQEDTTEQARSAS
jgi:hypothetical protein